MAKGVAAWFARTQGNYVEDVKNGVIWGNIAKRKSNEFALEILHKQLIRKNRVMMLHHTGYRNNGSKYGATEYGWGSIEVDSTIGKIYVVAGYNQITGGTQPYTKDGYNNLGMSQLFNGQAPTAEYNGGANANITGTDRGYIYCGKWGSTKTNDVFSADIKIEGNIIATYRIEDPNKYTSLVTWTFYSSGLCRYFLKGNNTYRKSGYYPDQPNANYILPFFYSKDNTPVMGIEKFLNTWSEYHKVYAYNNPPRQKWYKRYLPFIVAIVAIFSIINPMLGGVLQGTAGTVAATGAVISAYGTLIYLKGMQYGNKTLMKAGRVVGYIGGTISAIGTTYTFYVSNFSKAAASTLPNYNLANSQSLNQTASLYEGVSPASWANGSNLYQNTNSVMFSSEANSFKSALYGYNVGASAASSGISSANSSFLYLTKALRLAELGFKSYEAINNLIGAFRTPNEFRDDDMVEPEDDDNKVSLSSSLDELEDAGMSVRRFYDRDVEYDLGLESGTLMSNDDSLL
ncbi:hypothetical protein [Campylobacter curvus]|uniref:Uncharacterized protein n=1 Tax=Campylobacter curvus (strain 525.92) TaxID=360105 RepID=A7H0S7_CAMC5|nr:hypothetical protein [Campylobacter curvus]EAU00356.1 hypothetical protein CCV52592_0016 [Campylobacter curvus 525.92]